MAPRSNPTVREPVTATGADLLKLISNAGDNGLRLTQPEALEAINAGHATASPDDQTTVDETAVVTLTDAGKAALNGAGAPAAPARGYEIDTDVPVPPKTRRGRAASGTSYPFDTMPLNGSFHVPATADDPNPETKLSSSVSAARSRNSEDIPGENETVTKKTWKKDAKGGFLMEDGKRVLDSEETITRPKRKQMKDFQIHVVGAEDKRGPGARVYRIL